jgi:hypothetical protein
MKRSIFLAMAIISIAAQPALSLSKSDREAILALVGRATIITRADKLCPQYEFNVDMYSPTIKRAKELIGEKAVNRKIDTANTAIQMALAYGLKQTFCDMAKNSDAEMESALQ